MDNDILKKEFGVHQALDKIKEAIFAYHDGDIDFEDAELFIGGDLAKLQEYTKQKTLATVKDILSKRIEECKVMLKKYNDGDSEARLDELKDLEKEISAVSNG